MTRLHLFLHLVALGGFLSTLWAEQGYAAPGTQQPGTHATPAKKTQDRPAPPSPVKRAPVDIKPSTLSSPSSTQKTLPEAKPQAISSVKPSSPERNPQSTSAASPLLPTQKTLPEAKPPLSSQPPLVPVKHPLPDTAPSPRKRSHGDPKVSATHPLREALPPSPLSPKESTPHIHEPTHEESEKPFDPPLSLRKPAEKALRRKVVGGPLEEDTHPLHESAELKALREAEETLFPPPLPLPQRDPLAPFPSPGATAPSVSSSGLPSALPFHPPWKTEAGRDRSWLGQLALPTLPVRWEERVLRYLEFFKDNPKGRSLFTTWLQRSGLHRDRIHRVLRTQALPEDLLWVSMIESGFDPTARSQPGAAGLWQFIPEAGRAYGLRYDRWIDQRMDPQAATEAAAEYLKDLFQRFGSWELALAAYNMGYGAMLSVIRKYNTNDYWALAHLEGALPWETTLYVPKIVAAALVGRNLHVFGYSQVPLNPPVQTDVVPMRPGVSLDTLATVVGGSVKELAALNPALYRQRIPPNLQNPTAPYPVHVPSGKGVAVQRWLLSTKGHKSPVEPYVVRFGETLESLAAERKIPQAFLREWNNLDAGEVLRGGTVLFVPPLPPQSRGKSMQQLQPAFSPPLSAKEEEPKPTVVVPAETFVLPHRTRVFYRVLPADTLQELATAFHVSTEELSLWNRLDPKGKLHKGMTLQVFVPNGTDLSRVILLKESEVRVIVQGSEAFFAYTEEQKGTPPRQRITVMAQEGETLEKIAPRYGLSPASLERINHRDRKEKLKQGEAVVVYTEASRAARPAQPFPAHPPESATQTEEASSLSRPPSASPPPQENGSPPTIPDLLSHEQEATLSVLSPEGEPSQPLSLEPTEPEVPSSLPSTPSSP